MTHQRKQALADHAIAGVFRVLPHTPSTCADADDHVFALESTQYGISLIIVELSTLAMQ